MAQGRYALERAQLGGEHHLRDRFGEIVVAAGFDAAFEVFLIADARQEDDRDPFALVAFADRARHLVAVGVGHVDGDQGEVGLVLEIGADGRQAAIDDDGLVPHARERDRQAGAYGRGIVGNQDGQRVLGHETGFRARDGGFAIVR